MIKLNNMQSTNLWVEPLGDVVVVRLRGVLTESLLEELHKRVVQLLLDTGHTSVLYDGLEMEPTSVELALAQEELEKKSKAAVQTSAHTESDSGFQYKAGVLGTNRFWAVW